MRSEPTWKLVREAAWRRLEEADLVKQAVHDISPDDAKRVLASLQNPAKSPTELANDLRSFADVIARLPVGTPVQAYTAAINQIGAALAPVLTAAVSKK